MANEISSCDESQKKKKKRWTTLHLIKIQDNITNITNTPNIANITNTTCAN